MPRAVLVYAPCRVAATHVGFDTRKGVHKQIADVQTSTGGHPASFPSTREERMSDIPLQQQPSPEEVFEELQEWYIQKSALNKAKQEEHLKRVRIAGFYFPSPREGTNRIDLGLGFDLKLDHKLNYSVDEADLDNVAADKIKELQLPWEELFDYKPQLNIKTYRNLTDEQRLFVQSIITIKEGSPQMEIVPKANAAGQQAHIAAAEAAAPEQHPMQEQFDRLYVVSLKAEKSTPGQYFYDGETWWLLGEDMEWIEVPLDADDGEGRNIGVILHKQLERAQAAKPSRRGRPKKDK